MLRKLQIISVSLLTLFSVGLVVGALAIGASYRAPWAEGRIYPGVTVEGIDLSDLTRQAARARLTSRLPPTETQHLTIQAGNQTDLLTWAKVGQAYDIDAAVATAYQIGSDRPWWLGALAVLNPEQIAISLPITPADPDRVRAYVETLAAQIAEEPKDATLTIAGGQVNGADGKTGRSLDVEPATTQIVAALATDAQTVELALTPTAPAIASPEPALSEARVLLAEPFTLVVRDPLTGDPAQGGYRAEFTAPPATVATWLEPVRRGNGYGLRFKANPIRTWVESIAAEMDDARELVVDETVLRIIAEVLPAGERHVVARVTRPPRAYVVRPGDTFYDIAFNHGFPQWRLEQVNPDVDPGVIDVGQVLTIPSVDVLFPHPLVESKRIEIDLPEQILRAYEDDRLIFEFRASSGISTTPTLAGQFQILFKEELAFAARWRLDMPYFLGFYEERENFYNGIHELPITSYGVRLSRGVLGYPASYGCIILDQGDAGALYHWAEVGTLVRVSGVAPGTPFGQPTLVDIAPPVAESEP